MVDGITKRYELTATWDVLNDVISNNVTDTAIPPRQKVGDWIKNGVPNPGDLCKKDGWNFPLIIISPSEISDENRNLSNTSDMTTHDISIECRATTRLAAMQLAEEIRYILKITGQSELRKAALFGPDVGGSSEDSDFIGQTKYYSITIDYEFKRQD